MMEVVEWRGVSGCHLRAHMQTETSIYPPCVSGKQNPPPNPRALRTREEISGHRSQIDFGHWKLLADAAAADDVVREMTAIHNACASKRASDRGGAIYNTTVCR